MLLQLVTMLALEHRFMQTLCFTHHVGQQHHVFYWHASQVCTGI